MRDISNISVVLPSLDPDEKLATVVDGLLAQGFAHIILVNDGSAPENLHYFTELAQAHPQISLLSHPVNLGKGAALKTAFRYFLENCPEGAGIVTVDGDAQHHPEDTLACCREMLDTGALVLGCRDFGQPQVPARCRFGNRATSAVFRIFVGMRLSDTQTGLRAIPRAWLPVLNEIGGDRFEYETNMLLAIQRLGIPYREVSIRTVYIEENKSSHFRVIRDSWRIYKLILAHFFRYTLSSVAAALVDTGMYSLLNLLLGSRLMGFALTAAAGVGARAVSSLINFFLNQRLVFRSKTSTGRAMLRYYMLCLPQMGAQVLLTQGAYALLHIPDRATGLRTLIYLAVMCLLFLLSFMIQQRWVFSDHPNDPNQEVDQ